MLENRGQSWVSNNFTLTPVLAVARRINKVVQERGYSVSHGLMQVEVPARGGSGKVSATLRPWPPAGTGD